jgi:hypothetical protein
MARYEQPLANGISTDHPIPNLPFVDDKHIPVGDPQAIESIGRHAGTDMWGRCDADPTGEWMAFTTDPQDHRFAWVVRYHPDHGHSVVLYADNDAASVHQDWFGPDRPLLLRRGGYWWDGNTWYRPRLVLNWASESYVRRPVQVATTITAADLLDSSCKSTLGELYKLLRLDPATVGNPVPAEQWKHDLALWAARRRKDPDTRPLDRCVVTLNAPELDPDQLLGVEEAAQEAGIAASTLRAYLARGEADIPPPQDVDGARKRWSRPVIQDWNEQRRRDTSNVVAVLTGDAEDQLAPGLRSLWKRITEAVFGTLWDTPAARRQWSRPHRTEQAVRSVAEHAGWVAALHLDSEVPFDALDDAIRDSVLLQMTQYGDPDHVEKIGWIGLPRSTGQLLGWFIDHKPSRVPQLFGSIVRDAEDQFGIPPAATIATLRHAVRFDGGFEDRKEQLEQFLAVTVPPEK